MSRRNDEVLAGRHVAAHEQVEHLLRRLGVGTREVVAAEVFPNVLPTLAVQALLALAIDWLARLAEYLLAPRGLRGVTA